MENSIKDFKDMKKSILVLFFCASITRPFSPAFAEGPTNNNNFNSSSQNITEDNQIVITEIYANPTGKDQNKEWIELSNYSSESQKLNNLLLQINQKKISLSHLSIGRKKSITVYEIPSLKNEDLEIKLLKDSKIIQEIEIKKSLEGQSYSLTEILEENKKKYQWIWNEPSPNQKNTPLETLEGLVYNGIKVNKEYFFIIQNNKGTLQKIVLDSLNHKEFKYYQEILIPNTKIEVHCKNINKVCHLQNLKVIYKVKNIDKRKFHPHIIKQLVNVNICLTILFIIYFKANFLDLTSNKPKKQTRLL